MVGQGGCLFCRVIAGTEPSSLIYQDELTLAFMDLAQPSHGHSLIIPRQHVKDIFGLDQTTGAALFATTRLVAEATNRALKPAAITIWQQNGEPWQEVMHLHFHVLPRYRGDGLRRPWSSDLKPTERAELDRQAALIREALPDVS